MDEENSRERNETEKIRKLTEKQEQGAVNVVQQVLNQPEVQHIIKSSINRQTMISGIFMGLFLVGFFQIFNVLKTLLRYDWVGDLALGAIMLIVGASYMARQIIPQKKKDN